MIELTRLRRPPLHSLAEAKIEHKTSA